MFVLGARAGTVTARPGLRGAGPAQPEVPEAGHRGPLAVLGPQDVRYLHFLEGTRDYEWLEALLLNQTLAKKNLFWFRYRGPSPSPPPGGELRSGQRGRAGRMGAVSAVTRPPRSGLRGGDRARVTARPQAQAPGGVPGSLAIGQVPAAAPRRAPLHEEQVRAARVGGAGSLSPCSLRTAGDWGLYQVSEV